MTLLSRFSPDAPPTASTSTAAAETEESRRLSISSEPELEAAKPAAKRRRSKKRNESDSDDSDDDEAAGYVKLDATNIDSSRPQIVEFGRVDAEPEETGEQLREKRRRKRFFDVLSAEDVDLGLFAFFLPDMRRMRLRSVTTKPN